MAPHEGYSGDNNPVLLIDKFNLLLEIFSNAIFHLRFEYLENICPLHSAVINFITLFFHSIKLKIKVTDREENSYFCCTLAVRLYNSSACETVRFCYTVGVAKHKTLLS